MCPYCGNEKIRILWYGPLGGKKYGCDKCGNSWQEDRGEMEEDAVQEGRQE